MATRQPSSALTDYTNSPSPFIVTVDYEAGWSRMWRCCDRDTGTNCGFYTYNVTNITADAYAKIDIGDANKGPLESYYMNLAGGSEQINGWTLWGSSNDSTWDSIDTKSGLSTPYEQTITINGTTTYRYFKFQNFHVNNGDTPGTNVFCNELYFNIGSGGTVTTLKIIDRPIGRGINRGINKGI